MSMSKLKVVDLVILTGPSACQMIASLIRPHMGAFGIDMDKATAVQFTATDNQICDEKFYATVDSMQREDGSGKSWNIEGGILMESVRIPFSGYYHSGTRRGRFTLASR